MSAPKQQHVKVSLQAATVLHALEAPVLSFERVLR